MMLSHVVDDFEANQSQNYPGIPLSGSLVYLGDPIHHILAFLASYAG